MYQPFGLNPDQRNVGYPHDFCDDFPVEFKGLFKEIMLICLDVSEIPQLLFQIPASSPVFLFAAGVPSAAIALASFFASVGSLEGVEVSAEGLFEGVHVFLFKAIAGSTWTWIVLLSVCLSPARWTTPFVVSVYRLSDAWRSGLFLE